MVSMSTNTEQINFPYSFVMFFFKKNNLNVHCHNSTSKVIKGELHFKQKLSMFCVLSQTYQYFFF